MSLLSIPVFSFSFFLLLALLYRFFAVSSSLRSDFAGLFLCRAFPFRAFLYPCPLFRLVHVAKIAQNSFFFFVEFHKFVKIA